MLHFFILSILFSIISINALPQKTRGKISHREIIEKRVLVGGAGLQYGSIPILPHLMAAVAPAVVLLPSSVAPAAIIPYPSISFFPTSTIFSLTANSIPISVPVVATYHTSTFAATPGAIKIIITSLNGPIKQYSLQPTGSDVAGASVNGNTLTFTVAASRKLEIRINDAVTKIGDTAISTVMYLTIDLPENPSEIPSSTDKTVLFLGAGVHNLGLMQYNSTNLAPRMIYAAPGALVNAAWRFVGTTGLTISGRGYFRNAFQDKSQTMFYFAASKNIKMKDVWIVDSPQHVIAISSGSSAPTISSQFLIDNIKSLHRGGNSDGYSLFGPTNNVIVQNTLLVNMDNQIVLQAGLPTGPRDNTFINNIFVKPNSAGEDGLVSSTVSNAVQNLILDNINIVTWASRIGNTNKNYFLHLTNTNTEFQKSITFRNSNFPAFPSTGFSGSFIQGNWITNFINCTIAGIPITKDSQIGLGASSSKSVGASTSYQI